MTGTLDWVQNWVPTDDGALGDAPDRAARILLKVIEKHPEAVEDALDAA